MVVNSNITLVTTNTTLSYKENVYIVTASVANLTLTLPLITADGIQYKIKRSDTTAFIVTLVGTSGQTIDGLATFIISSLTTVEIHSYNNTWYIMANSVSNVTESTSLFTSAFVQNNGSAYITFSGTGTNALICSFYYPGSLVAPIYKVIAVLAVNGGTPTGSYDIRTQAGAVIATTTYVGISGIAQAFVTTTIANLPTGPSVLEFLILVNTPNSSKVNVYSLAIQ